MSLPTVKVYLDDGTGTFPYDISAYMDPVAGYSITRGRSDELATVSPGTLSLTLDNTTGRFSLGAVTYGIHIDQMIRVAVTVGATTSNRFTGFVQSWPVNWPQGSQDYSTVVVTAVDASARWGRRTMRVLVEEEILASNPAAYYPMTEPEGAIAASDVSGKSQPQMTNTPGSPVVFGVAPAPGDDGATGAQFDPKTWAAYLRADGLDPIGSAGHFYLECFFAAPAAPSNQFTLVACSIPGAAGYTASLYLDVSGGVGLTGRVETTAGPRSASVVIGTIFDGAVHHAAFVADGVNLRLYIDGNVVVSSAITGYTPTTGYTSMVVGDPTRFNLGAGTAITVSHAAAGTNITATEIADHSAATRTEFAGETSDLRIDRLIGYEGTLTSTAGDAGLVLMPAQTVTGKTVGDAVQSVVDAELGLLWINGSGQAQYANKDHVALATTPAMMIPLSSALVVPGTGFSVDMQQVTNYVTGQREGGDVTQVFSNQASINTHGTYSDSSTWLVQTDREVEGRSQWLIARYAEPLAHIPTLDLDLLIASSADQILALALDLDSHIKITGWPTQAPGGTTTDLVIEGYTENLAANNWVLSPNCASWTQQSVFILDDPVFGILDTSPLGI